MARTALGITLEERDKYNPRMMLEKRTDEDKERLAERFDEAWRLARDAASLLHHQYYAHRVVVFGSLVNADWFNDWSDIDLAAWGIPPEQFYTAVAAVTGLSEHFKIDLLDPDTCRPDLRQAIEKEGIEV